MKPGAREALLQCLRRSSQTLFFVLAWWLTLGPEAWAQAYREIEVVSFNVQFLGQSRSRDNAALVELLSDYDLVFIQEVIAPPYPGLFPDGEPFRPNERVRAFFDLMSEAGFAYLMSPEDTGPGPRNQLNSTATEYFIAFYRPDRVQVAPDLPWGFLADDVTGHPDFDRVPFAFPFRAGASDMVFISVHLRPGAGPANRARRAHELDAIWEWISARGGPERDYVVLGDMNIESCSELADVLPRGVISLNSACNATNTNVRRPKPYDHVMVRRRFSQTEIPGELTIVDLIESMRGAWRGRGHYPGDPYDHTRFRQIYSDHHPIAFSVATDGEDDD